MPMEDLHRALIEEMRDVLDAEQQLTKALPKMAKEASNEKLKAAFEEHLEQTKGQIERLEQAFEHLDEDAKPKTCKAMKGLVEEGEEIIKKKGDPSAKDAMLIGAAQKVEHYEIATYGTLCSWAEQMGHTEVHQLLDENLSEEKETDKKLSSLARTVNKSASPA